VVERRFQEGLFSCLKYDEKEYIARHHCNTSQQEPRLIKSIAIITVGRMGSGNSLSRSEIISNLIWILPENQHLNF
jgi:hypothetical protein